MAVTSQLCERIAGTDYENLGEPAIEAARRLVLDGIAIAIAGTEEEAIHILAAHHKEQGGAGQATAIGNGFRLNTVSASALNGAAMHVLDFEPMWSPANHALSTTLAGVLALAEAHGATGREVLTALIKGVEMQGWIRQASGQFEASTTRFHPPGAVRSARRRCRGRTYPQARSGSARERRRYRGIAGRQPAGQCRHHDQIDALRSCLCAGA